MRWKLLVSLVFWKLFLTRQKFDRKSLQNRARGPRTQDDRRFLGWAALLPVSATLKQIAATTHDDLSTKASTISLRIPVRTIYQRKLREIQARSYRKQNLSVHVGRCGLSVRCLTDNLHCWFLSGKCQLTVAL
jgi:hypothetical protein